MASVSLTVPSLVALCVPSMDMVHADFAMSFARICQNTEPPTMIVNGRSSIVSVARNLCVEAAIKAQASHIMFLDSDMIFPSNTIKRLLAHDKDIVGALYPQRTPPFSPLGVSLSGQAIYATHGLQQMQIMPTGCLLIRSSVFARLTRPYFNTRTNGEAIVGEDYHFCERARIAGFTIWCDGDLSRELGHIGLEIHKLNQELETLSAL